MPSTGGSEAPRSGGERLHALDALRATAMFLGIVLHGFASFAIGLPVPWIVRDVRAGISFDLSMAVIHGFRMPLFFFIAGFFARLLWHRLGTRGFIAHRGRRIAIPFLLGMVTILPLSIGIFLWVGTPHPQPAKISVPTMHLWFLEMLLVLYAIAMVVGWATERWDLRRAASWLDRGFDALFRNRGRALPLAALTILPLWSGPGWGEVDHLGASLWFAPRTIAYFALFFAAGWWLHRRIHLLDTLRASLAPQFTIAVLAFVAWLVCIAVTQTSGDRGSVAIKAFALGAHALYAWTMTFALTGLFLRIAAKAKPWARYLADSSYWCYLAHLPVLLVLQVLVAAVELPGWLKAWGVIAAASALLLASYEFLVRYTWLGALLNGPRRRALPAGASVTPTS